jgi:uncharacterized protein YjbJ (UPF0337 family)
MAIFIAQVAEWEKPDRKLLCRAIHPGTAPAADLGSPFPQLFHLQGDAMNKDQAKGGMKDIAGKAQEKLGQATNNRSQQAKGLAKQGEGKIQKGVGDVKDKIEDAGDKLDE